jgi:ABC-2 type transport system ATP-binding protein
LEVLIIGSILRRRRNALLTLSNVSKRYGSKLAVNDISFHISRGQVVGFLGVNGAGKTTTMISSPAISPPPRALSM